MTPARACLPLGLGSARTMGVGAKAANLDFAAQRGLPVPAGAIVLDATWRRLLERELLTADGESVHRGDVGPFLAELDLPNFAAADELLAVRSAFSSEDTPNGARAGQFTSVLRVRRGDGVMLVRALARVWASSMGWQDPSSREQVDRVEQLPQRRDVLVMKMVDAQVAGVAFSEPEFGDDLVEFVGGTAEHLLGGRVRGERLELARLGRWERGERALPPWQRRLQVLLRDVRRVFGDAAWDVEWADDGATCWLVQVRPVTRRTLRDEWFTAANHKEILPPLPSALMASVIASRADALFALYRELDPGLPATRPFLELFAGRPRINLSLLRDMLRRWGLPTALLTDSVGGIDPSPRVGLRPWRLLTRLPVLLRFGWLQLSAVRRARRARLQMATWLALPRRDVTTCLQQLGDAYVTLVHSMMALTGAMAGPLALLRRAGVLLEHAARHRTVTTVMFERQAELRVLAASHASELAHGELPDDPVLVAAWTRYLAEFGHRGVHESDVGVPRTREVPQTLLRSLAVPNAVRAAPPRRSMLGRLLAPLWWLAERPLAAREVLRHEAMRLFSAVRMALLELAQGLVCQGRLPRVEALFDLDADEVRRLVAGWRPNEAFWVTRQAERRRLAAQSLADTFRRSQALQPAAGLANGEASELRGLPLTRGVVEGVVWRAVSPDAQRPAGALPVVLVAPAIDAGWITVLASVAAVVVETGGELSHGSILVREVGVPAVTNVVGAMACLRDGARVWVDAAAGVVKLVDQ